MFFILSKLFWYLVQPLVVVLLLQSFGLTAIALRYVRTGIGLTGLGLLLLGLASLTPAGLLMMSVLENRVPRPQLPADIAGIVVLGGSFDTRIARTRGEPELNDAADRITAAMALSRLYPDAGIVFSGGSAAILADDVSESFSAGQTFAALGLPAERLRLEERSRNTHENAVYTRELVDPQPGETWLLVTSAYHMPRALGCFRKAGLAVLPYPVDYQTPAGSAVWQPSTATVRNIEKVHFAIREYLGLAAYWISGRTDALFPSA